MGDGVETTGTEELADEDVILLLDEAIVAGVVVAVREVGFRIVRMQKGEEVCEELLALAPLAV